MDELGIGLLYIPPSTNLEWLLGIPRERILYLLEDPQQDAQRAPGKSTKDAIEKGLRAMASAAKPDDVAFVVLIGHGTWDGKLAKFNLPGPDMSAAEFAAILKTFGTKNPGTFTS